MLKKSLFISLLLISSQAYSITYIKTNLNTKEGLSGGLKAEFNYEAQDGSTSEVEIDMTFNANYKINKNIISLLYETSYQENNSIKSDDNSFAHLRHIHTNFWNNVNIETFIQHEDDEFADLSSRNLIGTGLGKNLKTKSYGNYNLNMYYFGGVLYEKEKSTDVNSLSNDTTRITTSGRFSLENKDTNTTFYLNFYFQPNIDKFSDYRAIANFGLETKILTSFSLGVSYELDYNSSPFSAAFKKQENISTYIKYDF